MFMIMTNYFIANALSSEIFVDLHVNFEKRWSGCQNWYSVVYELKLKLGPVIPKMMSLFIIWIRTYLDHLLPLLLTKFVRRSVMGWGHLSLVFVI